MVRIHTDRDICKPRGMHLILCCVQTDEQELPEDRASLLRRRGDIDSKALVIYNTMAADSASSLAKLCIPIREFVTHHYKERIEMIRGRLKKDTYLSAVTTSSSQSALPRGTIELAIRLNIKLGFYGEYANDFTTAILGYSTAHSLLIAHRYGGCWEEVPLQWQFQRRVVADMCNYRLCKIFMKSSNPQNAISQFRKHCMSFENEMRKPSVHKMDSTDSTMILHSLWMAQQYKTFSDMLQLPLIVSNIDSVASYKKASFTGVFSDGNSLFYLQAAAKQAIVSRKLLTKASKQNLQQSTDSKTVEEFSIVEGECIGCFVCEGKEDGAPSSSVSDEAFMSKFIYLAGHECFENDALSLLRKIYDSLTGGGVQGEDLNISSSPMERYVSSVKLSLANEYYRLNDIEKARTLFEELLSVYRLEGWEVLLAKSLVGALNCAHVLNSHNDIICWSLEAASLNQSFNLTKRLKYLEDAVRLMHRATDDAEDRKDEKLIDISTDSLTPESKKKCIICKRASALRSVFNARLSFSLHDVKPRETVRFEVAILSNLPANLPLEAIELNFDDEQYNQIFVSPACRDRYGKQQQGQSSIPDTIVYSGKPLELLSGEWKPFYGSLNVRSTAQPKTVIVCRSVCLHISATTQIVFPLECESDTKLVGRTISFGKNNSIGQIYHKHYGVRGTINNSFYSIGTCQPISVRNDYCRSRRQRCPVLYNHHSLGMGIPVDRTYNFNNEIVVYPAAAKADVKVYMQGDLESDPLVGEVVPINVEITPRGESVRNPSLYFDLIDVMSSDSTSPSDALDLGSNVVSSSKATVLLRATSGSFYVADSYGVQDGLSNFIIENKTETITFYLRWDETAATDINVILRYTTDATDVDIAKTNGLSSSSSSIGVSSPSTDRVDNIMHAPHVLHFECEQQIRLRAIEPFHTEIRFEEIHGTYTLQDTHTQTSNSEDKESKHSHVRGQEQSPSPLLLQRQPTTFLPADTDVFMVSTITCLSNRQLEIVDMKLLPNTDKISVGGTDHHHHHHHLAADSKANSKVDDTLFLGRGEIFSKPILVSMPKIKTGELSSSPDVNIQLGKLAVSWRRVGGYSTCRDLNQGADTENNDIVNSYIQLPRVCIRPSICQVQCRYDDKAYVGSPFQLDVTLWNRTGLVHEFKIEVGDAGSLLYAGDRVSRVVVLPRRYFSTQLLLISTAAGILKLPSITVSSTRYGAQMETATGYIQVLPRVMSNSDDISCDFF